MSYTRKSKNYNEYPIHVNTHSNNKTQLRQNFRIPSARATLKKAQQLSFPQTTARTAKLYTTQYSFDKLIACLTNPSYIFSKIPMGVENSMPQCTLSYTKTTINLFRSRYGGTVVLWYLYFD